MLYALDFVFGCAVDVRGHREQVGNLFRGFEIERIRDFLFAQKGKSAARQIRFHLSHVVVKRAAKFYEVIFARVHQNENAAAFEHPRVFVHSEGRKHANHDVCKLVLYGNIVYACNRNVRLFCALCANFHGVFRYIDRGVNVAFVAPCFDYARQIVARACACVQEADRAICKS